MSYDVILGVVRFIVIIIAIIFKIYYYYYYTKDVSKLDIHVYNGEWSDS